MPEGQQGVIVNVKESLSHELAQIDALIARTLEVPGTPRTLSEAYRYATFSGGKRVRPILALICAEAAGGERSCAYPSAAAVEMIHAFSLVHDDLPALDNDDLRRGKPTLHKAHGEAMAILAGDGLLNHAFTVLCREGGGKDDPSLAGMLCAELAWGTGAMIDGQVYDTLGGFENGTSDERKLELIHRNKTGALITASCRMGALSGMQGSVDNDLLGSITTYGEAMGLMFQAVDDLLDVESTPEVLGKATQKDSEAGKLTYPEIFGIDGTRSRIRYLQDEALRSVTELGERADLLRAMCRSMSERVS